MRNITFFLTVLAFSMNSALAQTTQHSCGADSVHNPSLLYGSISDIDGNVYKTIAIGNQVWMAENLKTSHYPTLCIREFWCISNGWIKRTLGQAKALQDGKFFIATPVYIA